MMRQPELPMFAQADPRGALRTSGGRDELNLAEFPIALLSDRVPDGCKTLVFEDSLFDTSANALVTRRLTVTGSDRYGLPTAVDDEVLVALIQLTKLGGFAERRVEFTRYALIKLLGWSDGGESYDRLAESLNRWLGVSLYYDRAWWDKDARAWIDAKFHVLESVFLVDGETRRGRAARGRTDPLPSWFSWNEVVFRSFQAENLKRLDVDTYFALKSSVSKRVYRFLDKRFYHRPRWEFGLLEFAREHVGLSRNYTPAKVKEKLRPALDELARIGFLEPMTAAERYAKAGRGDYRIVLVQGRRGAVKPPTPEPSGVERDLVARGVTPARAAELAAAHPEGRVRLKLEVFDWLVAAGDKRVARSPAGYLVKSVEEDYATPRGFEPRADREAREREEADRRKAEAESARRRKADQARDRAAEAKVARHWAALGPAERDALDAEALASAEPSVAGSYSGMKAARNPMAGSLLRLIREAHLRRALGLPEAPAAAE